jgi:hypothetical protein
MNWYREVLGMTVLAEPVEISTNPEDGCDTHLINLVRSVFGPTLGRFLICHLLSANGTGIELFEFLDPSTVKKDDNFEYWKTGYFHLAITEPRIEDLAERIVATGGRKRTDVMELGPSSDKKICFCEDPFGNVIEIYSHSYKEFWAAPQVEQASIADENNVKE